MSRMWSAHLVKKYRTACEPRGDGLPRRRILLSLPAVLILTATILIALGWNGSSSGGYFSDFYEGNDPDLIAGEPQAIRTDEWKVGTPWIIAQAEQGFPAVNETFPGGMDAALPYDLPRWDWSVAFRPHLLGYLVLDLDQATAWRWWVSGFSLVAAAFAFAVTLLPRRPGVSAMLAIGFFASPFFQWWYQSTTLWPVTWALATMAALRWCASTRRPGERWGWALLVFYLTVVMAMGIYVPFIVPVIFVVAMYGIGLVLTQLRAGERWPRLVPRLVPILFAGATAAAVMTVWLSSRRGTVDAFLSTVYPGTRLTAAGTASAESVARTVSSSFSEALSNADGWLGVNSSEAATFFFAGLWLIPVFIWIVMKRWRGRKPVPWEGIGVIAAVAIFALFTLVPGWDSIAHLLYLDRSTGDRMRIGLGVGSFALIAILVSELDRGGERPRPWLSGSAAIIFVASQIAIAVAFIAILGVDRLVEDAPFWWLFSLAYAVCLYSFASGRVVIASAVFLTVSVMSTVLVNPLYSGVLDLRETEESRTVTQIDEEDPGLWVGIGDTFITALLVESGVRTLNGTQGSPSKEMWRMIDPAGLNEGAWNRIGTVSWIPGQGEPTVKNPAADQIVGTFDPCSDFAQDHVVHVIADRPLSSACLVPDAAVQEPHGSLTIYRVTGP